MAQRQLLTEAKLRDRVGSLTVDRILDDDANGRADPQVVTRVLTDASAIVWAYLPSDFKIADSEDVPAYIETMALDVGEALLYKRRPEFARKDGAALLKAAYQMLEAFKKQETSVAGVSRADTYAVVSGPTDRSWYR